MTATAGAGNLSGCLLTFRAMENVADLASGRRAAQRAAYFYAIRTVTVLGALALGAMHAYLFERPGPFHYAVLAIGLAYPHLAHYLVRRLDAGRRVEHVTVLIDNFVAGSVIYLVGFTLWPSFAIAVINLMTPMAFGGFSLMLGSAAVLAVAALLPMLVLGNHYAPQDSALLNGFACAYLFAYLCFFAHAVYLRTMALQASRRDLRQQKMAVEVAKKRSDGLLGSVLPPGAVSEYEAHGKVVPRRFDAAVLLVLDAPHQVAGQSNEAVRDRAGFVLQAVDAIAARHGLYALKNLGDVYIALGNAAGVAAATPAQVAAAAAELRRFGQEQGIPLRQAIHSGTLVAAVVEARKVGYDVFGPMLPAALALHARTQPNQIALSADFRVTCPGLGCTPWDDAYLLD